ncbi:TasA family protein [Geodermatophilus sp. SYSU D00691]
MTVQTRRAHRRQTRKVLAVLAAVGVAASVAGLATYGAFTDSTSVATTVQSGILSLDVGAPGGIPQTIPVSTTGFVPGDSLTRALNLENDGTVALSSVNLATTAGSSSALTTDRINGLQLTLQQCSRAWTRGGTDQLPTYTCDGTQRTLYSGPILSTAALPSPNSLQPGGTDNMIFTISLPTSAGAIDAMQGLTANVNLGFTGVQAAGTAR